MDFSILQKWRTVRKVLGTFGFLHTLSLIQSKFRNSDIQGDKQVLIPADASTEAEISELLHRIFEIDTSVISEAKKLTHEILGPHSNSASIERKQFFDKKYDIGENTALAICSLILNYQPRTVIETGVAAGLSSTIVLSALTCASPSGRLVSVDITEKCGELIPGHLKFSWDFRVLKGDKRRAFGKILDSVADCEVFIHDSDHSSTWQMFEVSSVLNKFSSLKILIVDDPTFDLLEEKIQGFERFIISERQKIAAIYIQKELCKPNLE